MLGGRCLFGGGVGNRLPLLRLLWPSSSNLWANVRAVASRYSTYHLGGECNSGSPSNFTRRVSPLVSDVDELRASADLKHRGTTGVVCSTSLGASGAGLTGPLGLHRHVVGAVEPLHPQLWSYNLWTSQAEAVYPQMWSKVR